MRTSLPARLFQRAAATNRDTEYGGEMEGGVSTKLSRRSSSSALKEAAGAGDGDRLIHHPLADAQVLVNPFRNFLVVAGDFVGLETGPRTSRSRGTCQPHRICRRRRASRAARRAGGLLTSGPLTASSLRETQKLNGASVSIASRATQPPVQPPSSNSSWGGTAHTENGVEGVMRQSSNL